MLRLPTHYIFLFISFLTFTQFCVFFEPVYSAQNLNELEFNTNVSTFNAEKSSKNTLYELQELKTTVISTREWVYKNSIASTNTELIINNEDYYNQLFHESNNNKEPNSSIDQNAEKSKHSEAFTNSRKLKITSPFGYRINPVTGLSDYHQGLDIPMRKGTPVYAYKKGIIKKVNNDTGLNAGKYVLIQHPDGSESYYMHLSRIIIQPDQKISEGELIGYSGSTGRTTGPHLHFEVRKNNIAVNPLTIGDVKWYIKSY